jgi:thiol-disulfide isomerase/thioredoxin
MKKIIILVIISMVFNINNAASQHLLGKIAIDSFKNEPYNSWFTKGYNDFHPTASVVTSLKKEVNKKHKFQLFFGSWCGDSKREVPRIIKLLDSIGISNDNIEIIGLNNGDSTLKQSPNGEEKGKHIFRVPTLIVYQNNVEVNRIIEFPVLTLEHDLLAIVKNEKYNPNYLPLIDIANWLDNGILINDNVSLVGLSNILKPKITTEYMLGSVSKLLFIQGKKNEAIKLAKINYQLFSDKYLAIKNLGDLLLQVNEKANAVPYFEAALKVATKEDFETCLKQIYKAKGL